MGCGDERPLVPGVKRDGWPLEDPKGKAIEEVRLIRDDTRRHVQAMLEKESWTK